MPESTIASSEMSQRRLVILEREIDEGLGKVGVEIEQGKQHAGGGGEAALPGGLEVLGQAIGGLAEKDDGDSDDLGGDVKRPHQARGPHGKEGADAEGVVPVEE